MSDHNIKYDHNRRTNVISVRILLLFCLLNLGLQQVQAQFVDFSLNPEPGDIFGYKYVYLNGYDGNTIDYGNAIDSASNNEYYLDPGATPYASNFPLADVAIMENDVFIYYSTSVDHWVLEGYGSEDYILKYNEPLLLFDYPLDSFTTFNDEATAIFDYNGVEIHRNANVSFDVSGEFYETFTPVSDYYCMFVTYTETYIDSAFTAGTFDNAYTTTVTSYYLIDLFPGEFTDHHIIIKFKSLSFDDGVTTSTSSTVRYYDANITAMNETAHHEWDTWYDAEHETININPVNEVHGKIQAELYTISGQLITRQVDIAGNAFSMPAADIKKGLYVLILKNEKELFSRTIMIY